MTNFNARITNVKIANFNTKPQNLPNFQNPFLLLSDTEALNKILDGGVGTTNDRVPNPAGDLEMSGNVKTTPKPRSRMPTQSAERLARGAALAGLTPTAMPDAPIAPIAPTANRDNPSTSMPDRFPREGLFDNLSDDGESGDEGAHGGSGGGTASSSNPNAPADEMGDEGHGERLTTTQRTTSNGSTVHSGTNLVQSGRINSDVGLSTTLSNSLATQNGLKVKEVRYNPNTGKYTLYYGNKLSSGRYQQRVELSAPAPAPAPEKESLLSKIGRAVGPSGGANYMNDRLNSRGTQGRGN
tara:strand:+ start:118 stop:1011 length:894 start_codon:yes stop_codon:yes gene_type:complete